MTDLALPLTSTSTLAAAGDELRPMERLALRSARRGVVTLLVSDARTVNRPDLTLRLAAALADLPAERVRAGALVDAEWRRLADAYATGAESPLWVDGIAPDNAGRLPGTVAQARAEHGVQLVVLDLELARPIAAQLRYLLAGLPLPVLTPGGLLPSADGIPAALPAGVCE